MYFTNVGYIGTRRSLKYLSRPFVSQRRLFWALALSRWRQFLLLIGSNGTHRFIQEWNTGEWKEKFIKFFASLCCCFMTVSWVLRPKRPALNSFSSSIGLLHPPIRMQDVNLRISSFRSEKERRGVRKDHLDRVALQGILRADFLSTLRQRHI